MTPEHLHLQHDMADRRRATFVVGAPAGHPSGHDLADASETDSGGWRCAWHDHHPGTLPEPSPAAKQYGEHFDTLTELLQAVARAVDAGYSRTRPAGAPALHVLDEPAGEWR